MNFHHSVQLSSKAACVVALLLFIYCLLKWRRISNTKREPPQPSGSWPVIGHLHLLKGLPHITLGKLADKYGPLFMTKLGVHRGIVVSTPKMAKECLGTIDKVFVDRPHTIFVDHLGYNSAMMGFSPYGPYWREMRKITTVELLSNNRLEMLKHIRIAEIRTAIEAIYSNYCFKRKSVGGFDRELLDMRGWFNDVNLHTTVRLIAGKSLKDFDKGEEYNKWRRVVMDFSKLAGVFVPADSLPFLRWLDIGGYEKTMKEAARDMDHVAQGWLQEHKSRRVSGKAKERQDFVDVMLDIIETSHDKPAKYETDTIIKATIMTMILGGTDTTAVTLTWALSLLLNHRDVLNKARDELDTIVGKERQVEDTDLKNLVYLQAILKETLRLYPAAPLSIPRESTTECTISGYHIPARARLFVNLYKIQRDPEVWPDPLEFRPERFLTTHKDYDFRGQSFGYMPFGSGKRICPGISFAIQIMQFTLANLLHDFEITTPSDETVDMTEGLGITNLKATPLEVILKPRRPDYISCLQ